MNCECASVIGLCDECATSNRRDREIADLQSRVEALEAIVADLRTDSANATAKAKT